MAEKAALIGAGAMGGAIGTRLLETGNSRSPSSTSMRDQGPDAGSQHKAGVRRRIRLPMRRPLTRLRDHQPQFAQHRPAPQCSARPASPRARRPGTIIIDMSSIDPVATRALERGRKRLSGLRWVDSPLSGGAPKALIGELTLMAGGEAEDVELTPTGCSSHVASRITPIWDRAAPGRPPS
jgi:2-hydroxy-3-oxopropionate reductase